jgi:predicted ATPase
VYVYGEPGSGKSQMQELFFETLDSEQKVRLHYNEFMLQIHQQEHLVN